MQSTGLTSLDELLLACRDPRSRGFVAEAIACYHAGAYRAAIIATWTAVVYDFVHKLTELSVSGNQAATDQIQRFERARASDEVKLSQEFERDIIGLMVGSFELLNRETKKDLDRLLQDRNRCAHPSMQADDEPFMPSAELARYHLKAAVTVVLSQPPVHGKAAQKRAWELISAQYFPLEGPEALRVLSGSFLVRARAGLIRSLTNQIWKEYIASDNFLLRRRLAAALYALFHLHRETVEANFAARHPEVLDAVEDDYLVDVIELMGSNPVLWDLASTGLQDRLRRYLSLGAIHDVGDSIVDSLKIPGLADWAAGQLGRLTSGHLDRALRDNVDQRVIDELVRRFYSARRFVEAQVLFRGALASSVDDLTPDNRRDLIDAFTTNNQVHWANGVERFYIDVVDSVRAEDAAIAEPLNAMKALVALWNQDDDDVAALGNAITAAQARLLPIGGPL